VTNTLAAVNRWLETASRRTTAWAGSTTAFVTAVVLVLGWLVAGPLFDFSDTWQLVANTFTTLVTFLIGFLILRAQNKDSLVVNTKLNELIAATVNASNRLIALEERSEEAVRRLHDRQAARTTDNTLPPAGTDG
jgi:low affinity Fe/Cu permease